MILEECDKILGVIDAFCKENEGNRLNRWLAFAIVNELKVTMQELVPKEKKPTTLKEIEKKEKEGK